VNLGLHLNVSKCEVIARPDVAVTNPVLQKFIFVTVESSLLLGAHLFPSKVLDDTRADQCEDLAKQRLNLAKFPPKML